MPKEIEEVFEKEPDATVRSGGDLVCHIAGHVDAMSQFAGIIEVTVVGEPYASSLEDALETAHVGVVIEGRRNTAVLLGQEMLACPVLERLDRLLKLLGQLHTAVVGVVGFRHGVLSGYRFEKTAGDVHLENEMNGVAATIPAGSVLP